MPPISLMLTGTFALIAVSFAVFSEWTTAAFFGIATMMCGAAFTLNAMQGATRASSLAPPSKERQWAQRIIRFARSRSSALIGVAAGLVVGAAISGLAVGTNTVPKIAAAEDAKAEASSQLSVTKSALTQALRERDIATASASAAATALKKQTDELKVREDAVAKREEVVSQTEQTIKENSFSGGMNVVGEDVAAGTYKTGELTSGCYYAWKSSTEADADIVDNNFVSSGTATVTLRDGQIFVSSRCGTWTKTG